MALPGVNPTYEYVGNNIAADGVILGQTTGTKVGYYGTAPPVQPTSASQAVAISTAAVSVSATQWCFTTSTQADGIVRLVNRLRADLVTLGIIKGS